MADLRSWNKELVIELIHKYKSFPCLWKIKSEEYKSKKLKEDAYQILIKFCKEKGLAEANRDFVVKKIQSLRGSFRKELKRQSDIQRSGRGSDEVYSPSLWYFNHLLFIKDQEQPSSNASNDNCDIGDESPYYYEINESEEWKSDEPVQRCEIVHDFDSTFKSVKDLSEYDIIGLNVTKKLTKMDPVQAIYAESIINNVLRKGLLKKLTEHTNVCDNNCDSD